MLTKEVCYFLALADKLNFTHAAKSCNVTQPTLTRAIQRLEADLGGPLFHRERAHTHLSELGRMILPYLISINALAIDAKAKALSHKTMEVAELRLGVMCTIGPALFSNFICDFHSKFSDINLVIESATPRVLLEALINGDLEVGLTKTRETLDERLHTTPLFKERFVVTLPKTHALVHQKTIQIRDLDRYPHVTCNSGHGIEDLMAEAHKQGVDFPVVFKSDRADWVLNMIASGLGWGIFPEGHDFPKTVETRPVSDPACEQTISLVSVRGRPHSPSVHTFVRAVQSYSWLLSAKK